MSTWNVFLSSDLDHLRDLLDDGLGVVHDEGVAPVIDVDLAALRHDVLERGLELFGVRVVDEYDPGHERQEIVLLPLGGLETRAPPS